MAWHLLRREGLFVEVRLHFALPSTKGNFIYQSSHIHFCIFLFLHFISLF